MSGIFPSGGVAASQALPTNLPTIDTTGTGCTTLYHNARCNSKVDPAAVNSIIAEIGSAVNCAGLEYDCTRYDNLCDAIKELVKDGIFGCLEGTFPDATGACSIQQLVLIRDGDNCQRLATYNEASATVATFFNSSVFGIVGPYDYLRPDDDAGEYTTSELQADFLAGTIDGDRLNKSLMAVGEFEVECDGQFEVNVNYSLVNVAPSRNNGNGATTGTYIELDGELIHLDIPGSDPLRSFVTFGNFTPNANGSLTIPISAGSHTMRVFGIASSGGGAQFHISRTSSQTDSITVKVIKAVE